MPEYTGFLVSLGTLTLLALGLFAVGLGFVFHAFAAGANEQGMGRLLALVFAAMGLGGALSSLYAVLAGWLGFLSTGEADRNWSSLWPFAYPVAFLLGGLLLVAVAEVERRRGRQRNQ